MVFRIQITASSAHNIQKQWTTSFILGCVFSREVWSAVLRKLHLDLVVSVREEKIFSWWLQERKAVPPR
jgi:hypothetical protein